MDNLHSRQRLEDKRLGWASSRVGVSQFNVGERQHATFRSTSLALPSKCATEIQRNMQVEPFAPYGEAASNSLCDIQRFSTQPDSSRSYTSTLQRSCGDILDSCGPSKLVLGSRFSPDRAGSSSIGTNGFRGDTPSISTAATVSAVASRSSTSSREVLPLSRAVGSELSGSICATTRQPRSPAVAPTAGSTYGRLIPTQKGASASSSKETQGLLRTSPLTGTCPTAGSFATPFGPETECDGSSHMRSSPLKLSGISATTGVRSRCLSPASPMSSSLPHLRTGLTSSSSIQKPHGQLTAAVNTADVESPLTRRTRLVSVASLMGASDFGAGRVRPKVEADGSSWAVLMGSASRGYPPLSAPGNLPLDKKGCPSSVSSRRTDRQDLQLAASGWGSEPDRAVGVSETSVATDVSQRADSRNMGGVPAFFVCRSICGPRTERVNAFLGFLKELFLDQDLIPATSVVDCLATLASYAQGLPAVQGTSLQWCCVAGEEIAPDSTDPVCLKDRVIVKLLNTLMQTQFLECAQVSPDPPQSGHLCLGEALASCSGLGKDPLALVLCVGSSNTVRVSLRPSSECGEPSGEGTPSLISLGSCSSLALSLSAIETVSRHHMPVGASPPPTASSKLHVCYSSFLRWLWEELCARKDQSEPFDMCTSLIACEACSSCICSEAECVYMLPAPDGLPGWLDSCNIDLAVLLLLSLASRPTRHPLALQMLERTSFSLDKCSAVGLAAWLRASAVMGLSSLGNPALFGRVLTAVAKQMPLMPLGTVLADVLWGLTLCGIPSGSILLNAVPGIARNKHMFELEDLCLIACCYALQKRGFAGVTGDRRHWSYKGYALPPEFFRRLTGLKAYCLLGCVKIADTGPTPVLGETGPTTESTKSVHADRLTQENAMYGKGLSSGECTPEELVRSIVDKCQGLRGYISLKTCRLLDFVEKIMENPSTTGGTVLHNNTAFLRSTVNLGADKVHLGHFEEFHESRRGSCESCFTGASGPTGDCNTASPPVADSCLQPDSSVAGPRIAQAPRFTGVPDFTEEALKSEPNCWDVSNEVSGGEQTATTPERSGDVNSLEPCEREPYTGLVGSMWGDQFVPVPGALSALHNYGAKAQAKNFTGNSRVHKAAGLFRRALSLWGGCASFAAHALFGYIVMVAAIYAFSRLP